MKLERAVEEVKKLLVPVSTHFQCSLPYMLLCKTFTIIVLQRTRFISFGQLCF